jgi:Protein of unknown function (DUF1344)
MRKTVVPLGILATSGAATPRGRPALGRPPEHHHRGVVQGDVVEGRINRVDQQTRTIRLDNGQEYVVPLPVVPDWSLLQAGVPVMMRYNVDAGRNLVTYLAVRL